MQAEHAYQAQDAFSLDNLFTARKLRARVARSGYSRIIMCAHIRGLIQLRCAYADVDRKYRYERKLGERIEYDLEMSALAEQGGYLRLRWMCVG
jgi:hypothetical protein